MSYRDDFRRIDAELEALLADSPITRASVISDVREYMQAGEIGLAFDTLCTWLYEDTLPITRTYHARLAAVAEEVYCQESMEKLDELICD